MPTFDKATWTAAAGQAWHAWWTEQLAVRRITVAELAQGSYAKDESVDSWRNTLDAMIKGDAQAIRRAFSPARETKVGPEVHLPRLCAVLSAKGPPVAVEQLWEQLDIARTGRSTVAAAAVPWHPAFAHVDAERMTVPAVLPLPSGRDTVKENECPAQAWAKMIASRLSGATSKPMWIWVTGKPGSGRRHAAREIARLCHEVSPEVVFEVLEVEPAGGWSRVRAAKPSTYIVAVAEETPSGVGGFDNLDVEVAPRPWTAREVELCAAKLLELSRIDALAHAKLVEFANRAGADPELLGPDKRPVAVVQLLAEIVAGGAPTSAGSVRQTLRGAGWAKLAASMPEAHYLRTHGQALMQQLWAASIAHAPDGKWWRLTRDAAQTMLGAADNAAARLVAAEHIDELRTRLDKEREVEKRKRLSAQIVNIAFRSGNVLIESLIRTGCLVESEGHLEPVDRNLALLDAASVPPVAISTAVLIDFRNLDLAREWGLAEHKIGNFVAAALACPEHVRPFAWRWILEFAWAQRSRLTTEEIRQFVVPAWAGVLLSEMHGYGDLAVHSWTAAQRGTGDTVALLREVSLEWSGILPDLDPVRPFQSLTGWVLPQDLRRLERWLAFRVKLTQQVSDPLWPASWLPLALVAALGYASYRKADPAQLDLHAGKALWYLAPGQLLALQPGHVTEAGLEEWQSHLKARLDCQAARAERGDESARAWMAGEHIPTGARGGTDPAADPLLPWSRVPIADRLKWLRLRARGEEREVALLNLCFTWGCRSVEPKPADHWSDFCAILERQPRDQLEARVAELALPWRPNWREFKDLTIADGLRLAERFGFTQILVDALEAPQRWLNLQGAARVRGKIRLAAPESNRHDENWAIRAFLSEESTWGGLAVAEAMANSAAAALHRLGQPQHLQRRWSSLPDWELPQALRDQMASLGGDKFGYGFEFDSHNLTPMDAPAAAEGVEWLRSASSPDGHNLVWWWTGGRTVAGHTGVWEELGLLYRLAVAPGRFDVAGRDLSHRYRGGDEPGNPSTHFWRWAGSPREEDLDHLARLPHILAHALWLWAIPQLPHALAKWSASLRKRFSPIEMIRLPADTSLATWDDDHGLKNAAYDRLTAAAQALLALHDDTPLQDWVASLNAPEREPRNWFRASQATVVARAVLGDKGVAVRAFRLALRAQPTHDEFGRAPIATLLDILIRNYKEAKAPVPDWLLKELASAPQAVALRFLRDGEPKHDDRYLPLLRSVLAGSDTLTEQLWCASAIRALEPGDPQLGKLLLRWLEESPDPFSGPSHLNYGIFRTPPSGGYADNLAMCVELWRAGQLPEARLRRGLHRISALMPEVLPATSVSDYGTFDPDPVVRQAKELRFGLELACDHLLRLAFDLGDRDLAERAAEYLRPHQDYRKDDVRRVFASGAELVAAMTAQPGEPPRCLSDLLGPEDAALRLVGMPEFAAQVLDFALQRLQRLLDVPADPRELGYVLLIFRRLGDSEWQRAIEMVPPSVRTEVLAATVAMGWDHQHADDYLNRVLPMVAATDGD